MTDLLVGVDVGSTTVKAVAMERHTRKILWKDYQKHQTRQPEKVIDFLTRVEKELGRDHNHFAAFFTGSGGSPIAGVMGAPFIQEVNAVSLAARRSFPGARSVVDLGGQDAKIVIFRENGKPGELTTIASMNDKCASGTGATIEKVARKVGIRAQDLGSQAYLPYKNSLLHIAAKCGVFAETDVVGHLKAGLPEEQILASLFDSIVRQNLSVLTRGYTLRPQVLLLGGPNKFIQGMVEAWRHNIGKMWEERNIRVEELAPIEDLVVVPENAEYFAAIGSVEFALTEGEDFIRDAAYRGTAPLERFVEVEREIGKIQAGGRGLWTSEEELDEFLKRYDKKPFRPVEFEKGQIVKVFLGIDGGSTSTKAVLVDRAGEIIQKSYTLSKGNPIQDTMDCVEELHRHVQGFGATLEIQGSATTGYAKDILAEIVGADAAIVETVAHTMAARRLYPEADVVVDVGGQDIKIIMLRDGRVSDFRLNTQCSAGNGYFLQSTAEVFNIPVEDYARVAFEARRMPRFGYGCAVFMQSDIVNLQKEGWSVTETMAGLADVLPKNIWLYVSQISNLASLGTSFVLQGGTQHNLAAVKAQVDFIRRRFEGKGVEPNVIVHEHCAEAGAFGAALEAMRVTRNSLRTRFIGLEAISNITYRKTNDERTRCRFCRNRCPRTFVDVKSENDASDTTHPSRVPLGPGWRRIIAGFSCDRGTVESVESMRVIKDEMDRGDKSNPNTVDEMSRRAFLPVRANPAIPTLRGPARIFKRRVVSRIHGRREFRERIRIGMPRVLNMFSQAPFFMGYFQALGIPERNLIFSQTTNEQMVKDGSKRGCIDPCFPSKVCIAHVHDLLTRVHDKTRLDCIFFPMVDSFPTFLWNVTASRACPTVAATPEAVKSAFTREEDIFARKAVKYMNPFLNLDHQPLLQEQLFDALEGFLRLEPVENNLAVEEGLKALKRFQRDARNRGREVIECLVRERRFGFVVLARPYHNDEGINHEILERLRRLGYPILSQDSLPIDPDFLQPLFRDDLSRRVIENPMEIGDVWPTAYSDHSSMKIWAAKVVARHPNLVALELSSFKCGHDAPPYAVIERIVSASKTPFFTFRDLDENNPGGAIKLRLETMDYFLKRERKKLLGDKAAPTLDSDRHQDEVVDPKRALSLSHLVVPSPVVEFSSGTGSASCGRQIGWDDPPADRRHSCLRPNDCPSADV